MQFLYGTRERNIDVTEILFREGGNINQSYNSLFGDPVFGIRKTLFWLRYGKDTIEFNEDQPISLNINRYEIIWDYGKFKQNYVIQKEIPRYMIRTAPYKLEDLPEDLYRLIIETKERNPAYQQVYFDDHDCLLFIKENFPQYLAEYNVLIPGAFKADLFRALFLYKYGGIYNDIAQEYLTPVDQIIGNSRMVLTSDRWTGKWGIYNAFMACRPREEFIKVYIHIIIERIRSRGYYFNPLDITGPTCFWDAFVKYFNHPPEESIRELKEYKWIKLYHFCQEGTHITDGNTLIIKTKTERYHHMIYSGRSQSYYDLWHERKVYVN